MGWLTKAATERTADCSFCRRNYKVAGALVEGPAAVYICGECAEVSAGLIEHQRAGRVRRFLVPGTAYRFATDAGATAGVLVARDDHWVQVETPGPGRPTWINLNHVHTVTEGT